MYKRKKYDNWTKKWAKLISLCDKKQQFVTRIVIINLNAENYNFFSEALSRFLDLNFQIFLFSIVPTPIIFLKWCFWRKCFLVLQKIFHSEMYRVRRFWHLSGNLSTPSVSVKFSFAIRKKMDYHDSVTFIGGLEKLWRNFEKV